MDRRCLMLLFISCFVTFSNSQAVPSQSDNDGFSIISHIRTEDNFTPHYNGKIIPLNKLNLTDKALKVSLKKEYYKPGEGPEDDDLDFTTTGDILFTSESKENEGNDNTVVTTIPDATRKPNVFVGSDFVKIDADFKPHYKGKVISQHELNLTANAKKVELEPDFYSSLEGPEDDDVDENSSLEILRKNSKKIKSDHQKKKQTSTVTSLTTADKPTTKPSNFSVMKLIPTPADFKPYYKGKIVKSDQLNMTDKAKKVNLQPDYYQPGEGPEEDDDDDKDMDLELPLAKSTNKAVTQPTTTTGSSKDESKLFRITDFVTPDKDFKPYYKGKIIPKSKLNLTEKAKKVDLEKDYYDQGEGPEDDDYDDLMEEDMKLMHASSTTQASSTVPKVTVTPINPSLEEVYEEDDIEAAVGGISGILQKLIKGPKKSEINNSSSPEQVYIYMSNVIRLEGAKAVKAVLPHLYDYQFPIGQIVSQRCYNSIVQFGERLRRGYVWPAKMVASSTSTIFNRFSLRDYGDFDRCLNVVAVDNERKPKEVFYTGQYCMVQAKLPLPEPKPNITYLDKILHFKDNELGGTFTDFVSLNAPFLYSNPLSFAMCIPSTCLPKEMEEVFQFFMKKFHISIHYGIDCYTKLNMTTPKIPETVPLNLVQYEDITSENPLQSAWNEMNNTQMWALAYFGVSLLVVILATIREIVKIGQSKHHVWFSSERNRPKSFIACFSIRYNFAQMVTVKDRHKYSMPSTRQNNRESEIETLGKAYEHGYNHLPNTSVVDGLKMFGLVWICLANFYFLGYQMQVLPSVVNLRETILTIKDSVAYQLVAQAWLSMEIFFLLSGFLMAYTSLPNIASRDGRPSILSFVIKRYIRFVPSVIFLLLAISILPLWKNAGPIYNSGIEKILNPCKRFYWRDLIFTANYYSHTEVCLDYFWYISTEFQLSLIGIFVTIFAYNRRKYAHFTFMLFIVAGMAVSGYVANVNKLKITYPIYNRAILEQIPDMIQNLYFIPPVHFTSYFLGLAIGYYSRARQTSPLMIPKTIKLALWLVLPVISLVAVYIPYLWPFKSDFKYTRTLTIVYFAIFRFLFISFFAWILHQSIDYFTVVGKLFTNTFFRVFSHIAFQIYLINLVIIWIYFFTKRTPIDTRFIDTVSIAISLFLITLCLAFLTYFLFEAPYRSLFRYYFESPRLTTTETQMNQMVVDGKRNLPQNGQFEMNPNFLFSPHYNMVNNMSRNESENVSVVSLNIGTSANQNGPIPPIPPPLPPPMITPIIKINDMNNNQNGNITRQTR